MTNNINIDDCRSYASEKNLDAALAKLGLDDVSTTLPSGKTTCRYMKVRNSEGRWTAIFLTTEYLRHVGGFVGFASQHGFMSV